MGDEIAQWREWNHDESLRLDTCQMADHGRIQPLPAGPERSTARARRCTRSTSSGRGSTGSMPRLGEQRPRLPAPRGKANSSWSSATSPRSPRNYRIGVPAAGLLPRGPQHRLGASTAARTSATSEGSPPSPLRTTGSRRPRYPGLPAARDLDPSRGGLSALRDAWLSQGCATNGSPPCARCRYEGRASCRAAPILCPGCSAGA